jgi:hypothetical protein
MTDELYNSIKLSFGERTTKPNNDREYGKFYYGMLHNLFGILGIINKKRTTDKNRTKLYIYSFDRAVIIKYLKLYLYRSLL